ncbi:hypothetical protein [Longispora albida]|uniref:hypothetical protein n=1 Tax=Longispora albida TaxID=203523 RepID=UPI00035CA940|nr:hypothetical protein [Longispora albida]
MINHGLTSLIAGHLTRLLAASHTDPRCAVPVLVGLRVWPADTPETWHASPVMISLRALIEQCGLVDALLEVRDQLRGLPAPEGAPSGARTLVWGVIHDDADGIRHVYALDADGDLYQINTTAGTTTNEVTITSGPQPLALPPLSTLAALHDPQRPWR